jgi:hypothetical protein
MLGGFQAFRGEATGSCVYHFILDTKRYSEPASVPHAPIAEGLAGQSIQLHLAMWKT